MSKQLVSQKFVLKITTEMLKREKWNLKLSLKQATETQCLIKLADSQVMRFIYQLKGVSQQEIDESVKSLRKELKDLVNQPKSSENRKRIKEIYAKLDELQFVEDYVNVEVESKRDFDYICKNGFKINGIKYKRFVGTTNGVKKSTVVFVSESVYQSLHNKLENGRNPKVPLVPAKYEAYKALACSSSIPVSMPNGVIVVKDCFTKFYSDYIKLDDEGVEEPTMSILRNQEIEIDASDGYGLMTPELAERWSSELKEDYVFSGCCIRNSFCKGMMFPFDFQEFADKYANGNYEVEDVWGSKKDIREVEMILTESMLKLWDSYDNLEDYLNNCEKNGYTFAITKVAPKKLDTTRDLNYQFIQSYDLTDEEIYQLALPTINEIKSALCGDINKTILFLKGSGMTDENVLNLNNDFVKAIMLEPRLVKDSYVRNKIYGLIKKRINDAKIGKLRVFGNFQILSGDPFALCQSIFGLEITGLLKAGQGYSNYWNKRNQKDVVCFRAPMSCHNNIKVLRLNNSEDSCHWFQYMKNVFILNAWDLTTATLNGCDFDGDLIFSTNNPVLLKNTRDTLPIMCVQRKAQKQEVTEKGLATANKNSFGNEVGEITNYVTSMYDVRDRFPKDSKEYKILDYRIMSGQLLQQNFY